MNHLSTQQSRPRNQAARRLSLHWISLLCALCALCGSIFSSPSFAQPSPEFYTNDGVVGIARRLKRAECGVRVLHVAAHPDDEDSALLAYLSLGLGARVTYLSLTRGEGGQNLIGPETGRDLGVIRTSELLAARRIDGAQQLFGREIDFGFSKTPEECFKFWGKENCVEDIVRAIRYVRPHIVICRFQGTPADGHGQHQASAIAAREAIIAAADEKAFPQLTAEGLKPWQIQKFYVGAFNDGPDVTLKIDTGRYDPWTGRSFASLGYRGRSQHRSQDMGMIEYETPMRGSFLHSVFPSEEREKDLLQGIALEAGGRMEPAGACLDDPNLAERFRADTGGGAQSADMQAALANSLGVRIEALADAPGAIAGGAQIAVACKAYAESPEGLSEPKWSIETARGLKAIKPSADKLEASLSVQAPADAAPSTPCFHPSKSNPFLYEFAPGINVGVPFEPPAAVAVFSAKYKDTPISLRIPVEYRRADPAFGEIREDLAVLPAASVAFAPARIILPSVNTFQVVDLKLDVRNISGAPFEGRLEVYAMRGDAPETTDERDAILRESVKLAAGESAPLKVAFAYPGEIKSAVVRFAAYWRGADGVARPAYQARHLDYRHIRPRWICEPARGEAHYLDVQLPENLKIGYVMGPGDEVAATLQQLGAHVDLLDAEALANHDLSGYNAVVLGIRAYETRPDLVAANERLFDYARAGGTLVVQYNKSLFADGRTMAPFPYTMSNPAARVTDETAAVPLLDPAHPLFHFPNEIRPQDFNGWIQERGLYFWSSWDKQYTPLMASADPGEQQQNGGLLVAPMGKGRYVYAAYAFFRQLPSGVEGATRLFVNLVSLGRAPDRTTGDTGSTGNAGK